MNIKFQTAAEYDDAHTQDCEAALVMLLRAFGSLSPTVRLVGGLVPRYLTPARPPQVPEHAGTTDVDIVLRVAVLAEKGRYNKLSEQLKANGFGRVVNEEGKPSSWRWERQVNQRMVMVEFLQHTDDPDKSSKAVSVVDEGVSAMQILHAGMVHDWYEEREIIAELPDGNGKTKEVIRYADAVSFIVLKAVAFEVRRTNKDAADLIHVMQHAGDPQALAAEYARRMREGGHAEALEHGLRALRNKFCDEEGVEGYEKEGPSQFCNFHQIGEVGSEDRIREQRNVSGLVAMFVELARSRAAKV